MTERIRQLHATTPNSVDNVSIGLACRRSVAHQRYQRRRDGALNFFNVATIIVDTAANDGVGGGSGNDDFDDTTNASPGAC